MHDEPADVSDGAEPPESRNNGQRIQPTR